MDNGDGEDGVAVAQRLQEKMEWDMAKADATRTSSIADRICQVAAEVDRAADAEAALTDAKKKEKLDEIFSQDMDEMHEMRLVERMVIRVST